MVTEMENRSLEFDSTTASNVVSSGYVANPVYEKGSGPINVKIVDPLNLASGYFECKFRNYSPPAGQGNSADTASWVIYRYDKQGGSILDSVSSDVTIDFDNEQIIPEMGFVQIHQEKYYFAQGSGNIVAKYTDMIDASITFADSSKIWLDGIKDNDAYFPSNWIRSGDYTPETDPNDPAYECQPNGPTYSNPCNYKDEAGVDPSQSYEGVLDGIIVPHKLVGYQADYMPMSYYGTFNGSSKSNASISFLPSVDIVITNDKSKWTRCPCYRNGKKPRFKCWRSSARSIKRKPKC